MVKHEHIVSAACRSSHQQLPRLDDHGLLRCDATESVSTRSFLTHLYSSTFTLPCVVIDFFLITNQTH